MSGEVGKAGLADMVVGSDASLIAAFLRDDATDFALNPFPTTSVGAAHYTWAEQAFEFPRLGIEAAGLADLQRGFAALARDHILNRYILKSPAHACTVFLTDGGEFVGAVLHGKPGIPLPVFDRAPPPPAPSRPAATRRKGKAPKPSPRQLDLFAEIP